MFILASMVMLVMFFKFFILIDYLLNYKKFWSCHCLHLESLRNQLLGAIHDQKPEVYTNCLSVSPYLCSYHSLQGSLRAGWGRNWGNPSHLIPLGSVLIGILFYLSRGALSIQTHTSYMSLYNNTKWKVFQM